MTFKLNLIESAHAEGESVPVPAGTQAPVAQTQAAGGVPAGAPPPPSPFGMLLPLVLMFGVFYFLMIRPQQRKMKKQNEMLSALTSGDEVVLSSGIIGKVAGLTDKVVTLEVAKDVKVKVLKSQVSQVVKGQVQELA
jgi:preprotein translocase subunit YajC